MKGQADPLASACPRKDSLCPGHLRVSGYEPWAPGRGQERESGSGSLLGEQDLIPFGTDLREWRGPSGGVKHRGAGRLNRRAGNSEQDAREDGTPRLGGSIDVLETRSRTLARTARELPRQAWAREERRREQA